MNKIEILQSRIEDNVGAIIISPKNRLYFIHFESSDGYLLVTKDDAVFITDSRYIEAAEKAKLPCKVKLQGKIFEDITEFFSEHRIENIMLESGTITLKDYRLYQKHLPELKLSDGDELNDIIDEMRKVKSADEVSNIKKAQAIAEAGFDYICKEIKAGKTEKEIQLSLDFFMLSNGADAVSFDTICVSGKNSSLPHGVPSQKRIENEDFVTLDFGAVYKGYHSDMTRTVAVGFATDEMKKVYNVVLEAQKTALESLAPDISCIDADKYARDIIENAGYGEYFGHGTGHGVGVEIHELPNLSPRGTDNLRVGNVVTVEPGIYLPDKFGVRIEDMALITENGYENLTKSPKELIIL